MKRIKRNHLVSPLEPLKTDYNEANVHISQNQFIEKQQPHETVSIPSCSMSTINEGRKSVTIDNDELFGCEDMFDDSFSEASCSLPGTLNLETYQRCSITSVKRERKNELTLCLSKCSDTVVTGTCCLRGTWAESKLYTGDIVSVMARMDPDVGWVVDDCSGLLVAGPDVLISGTSVVGSLFCMRRAILSDSYRDLDCTSSIMTMGSLVHELFQEVLKRELRTEEEISMIVKELVSNTNFVRTLYASQMSMADTVKELESFIPYIVKFVECYVMPVKRKCDRNGWTGEIISISDIEETIWSPHLGVKGKVDVTVRARKQNQTKVMPLELKTGRATMSAEHRGQVILYTMMLSDVGLTVNSGVLLYLREGVMQEVRAGHPERRDLIQLRNQLAHYLTASRSVDSCHTPQLPDPINHHSACAKCPYLTLCSAVLRESGLKDLSSSNPLTELAVVSTKHLTTEHIRFIFYWVYLLRLEEAESRKKPGPHLKDIWCTPAVERQNRGSCLSSLRYHEVRSSNRNNFENVFLGSNLVSFGLSRGDYVVVSTHTRLAIATGTIINITDHHVTVLLDRDLVKLKGSEFQLDLYESQTLNAVNMSNLGSLLEDTEKSSRLRDFIINRTLPAFSCKLSSKILKLGSDLLVRLNSEQRRAILQALSAQHFVLIKGMPGTAVLFVLSDVPGKTATTVALIELLVRLGKSVLVTSHTHSAVDNVLLRLVGRVDFLRLGATARVHLELRLYSEEEALKAANCTTPEQLEAFYNSKAVVGVTCLGAGHPVLSRRAFDVCLVDEASQILLPTVLRPICTATKFILVGDPKQLPPLVLNQKARDLGLGKSLFAHLDRPAVTTTLRLQYRMNATITSLANVLTYGGDLKCANRQIEGATLGIPCNLEWPSWLSAALSDDLKNAVVVLDTGFVKNASQTNQREVDIIFEILATLKLVNIADSQVGVIAPYRAQVSLLQKTAADIGIGVEINTVDQFQGRDKDVILFSCTRSSASCDGGILSDSNRLNVAITRAKHKLILVGDVATLIRFTVFKDLFSAISAHNIVSVS